MKLLALDISSTNIGVVVWDMIRDTVFDSLTTKLKGDLPTRLYEGSKTFVALIDEYLGGHDVIAFEDAAHHAKPLALIAQQRMVGCLFAAIERCGVVVKTIGIPPSAAKKALSGSGRADKTQMIACASAYMPNSDYTEHEADALGVALAALVTLKMRVAA